MPDDQKIPSSPDPRPDPKQESSSGSRVDIGDGNAVKYNGSYVGYKSGSDGNYHGAMKFDSPPPPPPPAEQKDDK